jgi:hypothetical protein
VKSLLLFKGFGIGMKGSLLLSLSLSLLTLSLGLEVRESFVRRILGGRDEDLREYSYREIPPSNFLTISYGRPKPEDLSKYARVSSLENLSPSSSRRLMI